MIAMLPSEKAKELVNQFCFYAKEDVYQKWEAMDYAKACCDEIIKSHQDRAGIAWSKRDSVIIDYWDAVKKEIEKL